MSTLDWDRQSHSWLTTPFDPRVPRCIGRMASIPDDLAAWMLGPLAKRGNADIGSGDDTLESCRDDQL
jgi:hypothetical protein